MRGDWIYDWVQVEMAYRTGGTERRAPVRRTTPSRPWTALRSALFAVPKQTGARPRRLALPEGK
ncbi:hypothetical protein [Amycolatopsis sp. WQ 127309]|uniref:hypothetical protein n=1 Tax=Amycolatopsis sp. WQ 127309 TaxID=2932773 RepID=UPI001FF3E5AC|nr:hypothetical protein [Amycolatopsis sp. WQ 127309]UOZ04237.1 hypothetical protein MUY22_36150 [Amycolatopsis sp. WQ 127309]